MAKYNNIFNAVNNEELSNLLLDSYRTMITETGDTSFSRFSETIMDILKDSVKPHSVRGSRKADNSWKAELEAPFKGRGNGWIKFKAGSDAALAIIDKLDRMVLDNVDDIKNKILPDNCVIKYNNLQGGRGMIFRKNGIFANNLDLNQVIDFLKKNNKQSASCQTSINPLNI